MTYGQTRQLKPEAFRRLTGVKESTFERMVEILQEEDKKKKSKGGRKNKLTIKNQLLMALEYIREYRTYFHIGQTYGVSESSAYKTIRWVENTLVRHPDFALPGRKALLKTDTAYEVVLLDATETTVERPKKSSVGIIQGRRKGTP